MQVHVFSALTANDFVLLARGAGMTILMTLAASVLGTLLGLLGGLAKVALGPALRVPLDAVTDALRSVPLLVQLTLLYAGLAILGLRVNPFTAGTIGLSLYAGAYITEIVRGGILAVPVTLRKAARGLGMNRRQEYVYIVLPVGLISALPAWIGVLVGVVKDSAIAAVIGYIELLRTAQIIITRTQEPAIVLCAAGIFYFAICYPVTHFSARLEARLRI
jgi:His/Glu/Gln/Arg/opine family amino acid ABC transporter permease subunit